MKKLVVILPAFNEAKVLAGVLHKIRASLKSIRLESKIVVVDDGSTDKTAIVAKKAGALVLVHKINRGLGAALGTGLAYAHDYSADLAVTMDSDGQHDPNDIKLLLQPLIKNQADVVIGSRLLTGGKDMPWLRRLNNRIFNWLTWSFSGIKTSDSLSGFRAFNHQALAKIELKTDRMEASNEFFSEIARNKLRFAEVSIRVIYTPYSLQKGVRPGTVFAIIFRMVLRLLR